ncbi:acetyl-CoA hydrolase/transferase family protein [Minwuia thermotolerans]|uniref:4-hydroxybutyrate CoA-transferase n=1 Tax=Minwuia thermotolerans TaxID=2056226 RepID=A0A2M9FWE5_9PROT|nr:acetyl-CoA hydrolase/transferase C-terminal domain-containing protein [Minwuia thermotolerans]PJK27759.1 4-hydroxybutyrate CoA-transferase [Minwuia thermotolerans]
MTEFLEAAEAVKRIPAGATVYIQGSAGEPTDLVSAIAADPEAGRGCTFVGVAVPGMNRNDYSSLHESARAIAFFGTPDNRDSMASGKTAFIPKQYHALYRYLEQDLDIDVALVSLREGPDGTYRHGFGLDSQSAVLDKAKLVIAEINAGMPDGGSAPPVPADRIDIAVRTDHPGPTLGIGEITPDVQAVADNVAAMIADGDCIQIGIGTLPVALLRALRTKNDLGIHSGMLADGMPELIDNGNANGRRKSIDTGLHVAGVPNGSQALYDWTDGRRDIAWRPISYTHDSAVIGRIDNFISINSGLEVDLFGQLNAETVKGRQISGTGGSVDFMRGAQRSRGGKAILAMTATAARGKVSRIVAGLDPLGITTGLRTDIDHVVTEHGAAHLKNLPVHQRPEALIEIAGPDFREELRDAWHDMTKGLWPG